MDIAVNTDDDADVLVVANKAKLQPPPLYKVILLNDDDTPMYFVVDLLSVFFNLNSAQAEKLMLEVHHEGSAVCAIYPHDIAQTKAEQINQYSRSHSYPLTCIIEAE